MWWWIGALRVISEKYFTTIGVWRLAPQKRFWRINIFSLLPQWIRSPALKVTSSVRYPLDLLPLIFLFHRDSVAHSTFFIFLNSSSSIPTHSLTIGNISPFGYGENRVHMNIYLQFLLEGRYETSRSARLRRGSMIYFKTLPGKELFLRKAKLIPSDVQYHEKSLCIFISWTSQALSCDVQN